MPSATLLLEPITYALAATMIPFLGVNSASNASLVSGVCSRFAEYFDNVTVLSEKLLRYKDTDLSIRLAPIDRVVQQLALRCSSPGQLRNLLLAVARIMSLSAASTRSLMRSMLTGCRDHKDILVDAILQLSDQLPPGEFEAGPTSHSAPWRNDETQHFTPHSAFAIFTTELLRLTDDYDDDDDEDENGDLKPCLGGHASVSGDHAADAGAGNHNDAMGRGYFYGGEEDNDQAEPVIVRGGKGSDSNAASGLSVGIASLAQSVVEELEAVAVTRLPEALELLAQAVSERLYPLDPGLACSWALQRVQDCCCGARHMVSLPATTTTTTATFGPGKVWRGEAVLADVAAFRCAPHLVAVLGLPLTVRTVEEQLLHLLSCADHRFGSDGSWDELAHGPVCRARAVGMGATVESRGHGVLPVSLLLAAVAALGVEGEEEVWRMMGRVVGVALSGSKGSPEIEGGVSAGGGERNQVVQQQQQQQRILAGSLRAAAALAVAEGVVLASAASSSQAVVTAATIPRPTDPASSAASRRLEILLRPLLFPEAADPAAQRQFDGAVRAVEMHVKRAVSHQALCAYERMLCTAAAAAGGPAGGKANNAQLLHHHYQDQQRQLVLCLVRSRMQHVAQGLGGYGGGSGGPGAAMGGLKGLAGPVGDPVFVKECLQNFALQGNDHLSKMSGFYRAKWMKDVKPVLLRLTLDEAAARQKYRYLKEACECFRLITVSELEAWEKLHEQFGMDLEEPRAAARGHERSGAGGGEGGGDGSEAVLRSPFEDLLRRLVSLGPSLTSATMDAVMGALEAALADELSPGSRTAAATVSPQAPLLHQPKVNSVTSASMQQQKQEEEKQEVVVPEVAAHVAELVLEAFVAAEELELAMAGPPTDAAAPGPAAAAAAAAFRPALRRRQSHLSWQRRLLDAMVHWPQLHVSLSRRLLQLATDPALCSRLNEAQVMGLAAVLAAMSCVSVNQDDDDAAAAATSAVAAGNLLRPGGRHRGATPVAVYAWRVLRCIAGGREAEGQGRQRQPQAATASTALTDDSEAEGVQLVPGPALAQAVLGSLPLGPSAQQLRFTVTFLAAYLRQCSLLGRWVLYEVDDSIRTGSGGGDGSGGELSGRVDIRARRGMASRPSGASFTTWPAPYPVWFSPPVDVGERRQRQQPPAAGCVPATALRCFMWIQKYGEVFGESVGDGDIGGERRCGTGAGDRSCWADVRRVCDAFSDSGLGKAMLEGLGAACTSRGTSKGDSSSGTGKGIGSMQGWVAPSGGAGALWDEVAMLRLTVRALEQGLQLPSPLMEEKAALLLRHLAPTVLCSRPHKEGVCGSPVALRVEGEEEDLGHGLGQGRAGLGSGGPGAALELGGLPGAKRVRLL